MLVVISWCRVADACVDSTMEGLPIKIKNNKNDTEREHVPPEHMVQ